MKSRFVKYWLPVLGWMFLIFGASTDAMSAEHTSRFFLPLLHWLNPGITSVGIALSNFFVRKAAHVTEYAILAALLWRAVRDRRSQGRKYFWPQAAIVWLAATAYAGLDEFHQSFVISRTASIYDVMIDASGAFLALVICWFFVRGRAAREMEGREIPLGTATQARLARLSLASFLIGYVALRVMTILLMAHRIPERLQHLGPIYLHHFHNGIVVLAIVAALLLFHSLGQRERKICAALFGIGVAMMFDDFGGWVHLAKSYWQRAGFDAVVVFLGALAVLAFAPRWTELMARFRLATLAIFLLVILFYGVLFRSVARFGLQNAQRLSELEEQGNWRRFY